MEAEDGGKARPRWVAGQARHSEETKRPDFRAAVLGPKGYKEKNKRKLQELQEQAEADAAAMGADAMEAGPSTSDDTEQHTKRRKADGVPFIPVSGRVWKPQAQRASTVMKAHNKNSSWEKKMKDKSQRQNFLEQKRAAQDEGKAKRKAKAMQRKAAKERKETNQAKSVVVQKITNASTLKRMMKDKKQKKLLKKADTTVVDKS